MLPRRYLPSMASLLALEALDRLGTASAAAAELSLTQGAISRQLQVLQYQLGVALTRRDHGRLHPTPAAKDYVAEVRRALTALSQASLPLRANPTGGALNLAILPAFGMHWLAPPLCPQTPRGDRQPVNPPQSLRLRHQPFRRRHPLWAAGLARRRLSQTHG